MRGRLVAIAASSLAATWLAGSVSAHSAADVDNVTVTGKEFEFEPSQIAVTNGEEVIITFRNEGKISHNLTIPGLEAGTETIQSGAAAKLKVTPHETGAYSFVCTVPGHESAGMHGELVVE